jgi:hypothetical protein
MHCRGRRVVSGRLRRRWMRPTAQLSTVLAVACGLLAAGCAPTARTTSVYESKAVRSADAVHSAVASDLVLLRAVRRGHTLAAYVSVATSQAEDDGSSASSSFLSIQPPSQTSTKLRAHLAKVLNDAEDALSAARIAGRAGHTRALLDTSGSLRQVARRLDRFSEAHQ